ncbi:MAG TPA: hypothetical protein PKE63_09965 [Lacibacter sp.]|nr:hypothetical protein [Lacibacter sp.]HMO90022.1 hypothetical protein [Lacibacter sp.]HMP87592.1 hypothetical protein [Lacibacter sp.]
MKFIKVVFLGCASLLLFSQCGKDCARDECPLPKAATFAFRLVNSSNQDLLTGPAKVYDTVNLRIRARRISTGAVEEIQRLFLVQRNAIGTADSIITAGFTVNNAFGAYYLVLNNTVTDSLFFGFNNRRSECCDQSSYFFDRLNLNDLPNVELPTAIVLVK